MHTHVTNIAKNKSSMYNFNFRFPEKTRLPININSEFVSDNEKANNLNL